LQLQKFYNQESLEEQYSKYRNIQTRYPDRVKPLELEKSKLERKLNEQSSYYKNLYEDKMKKVISEEEFLMLREAFLQELENSKKRIQVIEEELKLLNAQMKKKENIAKTLQKYKKIDKLDKVIIDEFIDRIYIGKLNTETKERDIIIEWGIEKVA